MDWKEAAGVIVGGVALLLPAIKWLISDWAKKAEEIEKLKRQNQKLALESLEEDVKEFKGATHSLQTQMTDLTQKLLQAQTRIIALDERMTEYKKTMETFVNSIPANVRQIVKTEMVDLGKQAALIRNKKNGQ